MNLKLATLLENFELKQTCSDDEDKIIKARKKILKYAEKINFQYTNASSKFKIYVYKNIFVSYIINIIKIKKV